MLVLFSSLLKSSRRQHAVVITALFKHLSFDLTPGAPPTRMKFFRLGRNVSSCMETRRCAIGTPVMTMKAKSSRHECFGNASRPRSGRSPPLGHCTLRCVQFQCESTFKQRERACRLQQKDVARVLGSSSSVAHMSGMIWWRRNAMAIRSPASEDRECCSTQGRLARLRVVRQAVLLWRRAAAAALAFTSPDRAMRCQRKQCRQSDSAAHNVK